MACPSARATAPHITASSFAPGPRRCPERIGEQTPSAGPPLGPCTRAVPAASKRPTGRSSCAVATAVQPIPPAVATAAAAAVAPTASPPERARQSPAAQHQQPDHTSHPGPANHSWASDVAAQVISAAAQLLNAVMTWRTAVHDSLLLRVSPFLIFCWFAAGLLVALCAPQFHIRHRSVLHGLPWGWPACACCCKCIHALLACGQQKLMPPNPCRPPAGRP